MASPQTFQPSGKDNYLGQYSTQVNTNFGTNVTLRLVSTPTYNERPILSFDISTLPAGAVISSAQFLLSYYLTQSASPSGVQFNCCKITRNDWVETGATWNSYKSGSAWTTAGGDYVTTNPAMATYTPPNGNYGWWNWEIKDIAVDAVSNISGIVNLLVRFNTENTADCSLLFHSNNYTTDNTLCPKLVITYTVPSGPANLKSYNTNLKANIKSINGNLIANCKSLNTNI